MTVCCLTYWLGGGGGVHTAYCPHLHITHCLAYLSWAVVGPGSSAPFCTPLLRQEYWMTVSCLAYWCEGEGEPRPFLYTSLVPRVLDERQLPGLLVWGGREAPPLSAQLSCAKITGWPSAAWLTGVRGKGSSTPFWTALLRHGYWMTVSCLTYWREGEGELLRPFLYTSLAPRVLDDRQLPGDFILIETLKGLRHEIEFKCLTKCIVLV